MGELFQKNPIFRSPALTPLLCAMVAAALYVHTLGGAWIYDDLFHAHDDPRLSDVHRWSEYLTQGYMPEGVDHLWRPLVSLSFAIEWKLGGGRAWPFHLLNILLHAAASALVAELGRRLSGSVRAGLIGGLLFAAHPLHVEGVAYLVGRAESICAIGILGALVLTLKPMSTGRALGIFGCFLAALLSKEQGLLLPAMLLVLWKLRGRIDHFLAKDPQAARAGKLLLLLILFSLAGYVIYREHILPWYWQTDLLDYATQPMIRSKLRDRVLIPIALFGRAIALLVAPLRLSPEYGLATIGPRQSWGDPFLYLGAAGIMATFIGGWIAWRRRARTVLFLLFGALLTYSMVSNIKLIGVVFAERLLYIPSAFVLILAAMWIARLPGRAAATALTLVLLLGWGIRTVTYAQRWNDRISFYESSLRDNPKSARLAVLLAREKIDRGDWGGAKYIVDAALSYSPDYWKLWALAARIAIEQNRLDDAQRDIRRAWDEKPFPLEISDLEQKLYNKRAATSPAR